MPSSKARPPFHRDGWVIEEKVDGWRIVVYIEPHGARAWQIVERRGFEGFVAKDPTSSYRSGPTR